MGFNLALNLYEHGVQVIGCDPSDEARKKLNKEGIQTCSCIKSLVEKLSGKRIIWLMVPSGEITESCISEIKELLKKDDIVIDAGNSNYKDYLCSRAMEFQQRGIRFLDVGTSGGIAGARNGACLMIGGDREAYEYLEEIFQAISEKDGCLYTGKSGSGHFMKMIHNGIEYGMMPSNWRRFSSIKKKADLITI